MTRIEKFRKMTDEQVAYYLMLHDTACTDFSDQACKMKPECDDLAKTPEGIPIENCIECLLDWLHGEAD